ncbi:unnamed protein product, partial [Ranitomeya imitator]
MEISFRQRPSAHSGITRSTSQSGKNLRRRLKPWTIAWCRPWCLGKGTNLSVSRRARRITAAGSHGSRETNCSRTCFVRIKFAIRFSKRRT